MNIYPDGSVAIGLGYSSFQGHIEDGNLENAFIQKHMVLYQAVMALLMTVTLKVKCNMNSLILLVAPIT